MRPGTGYRWVLRIMGAAALLTLVSCSPASTVRGDTLPSSQFRGPSALATLMQPQAAQLAALRVLDTGADALHERAALIEAAQHSIDAQYYIWNSDLTGRYLALRIIEAADRGVRVRLLLDDINTAERDAVLAALASHENISLRIYNPFAERKGMLKTLNLVGDFSRLNRRMHNKSFTVDGAVTIIGGRNIGDEYFDADHELNFRDRDIVAAGPVVSEVGGMFDLFWNSPLSVPIALLSKEPAPLPSRAERAAGLAQAQTQLAQMGYQLAGDPAQAMQQLRESRARMIEAPARLVHDNPPDPEKLDQTDIAQPSASALIGIAQSAKQEILIESAYLVFDDPSLGVIRTLEQRGVRIAALTNSLSSNDVLANHAAYARRRVPMLESGMRLFEMRPDAPYCQQLIQAGGCSGERVMGLHSKTVVFDRSVVAIGSMNLNLRSAYLNAETVMIIDSAQLATQVADAIELGIGAQNSWQVSLVRGSPHWRTEREGSESSSSHEPETSWWRRFKSGFIASLPLEKYL